MLIYTIGKSQERGERYAMRKAHGGQSFQKKRKSEEKKITPNRLIADNNLMLIIGYGLI